MRNININRLHEGSRVEDAMDIFRAVIDYNNLDNHSISQWGGEVLLSYLTDPEGWLGVWMLKSDEFSALLFGRRIWDAVYIRDDSCVQSIRPTNLSGAGLEKDADGNVCATRLDVLRTYSAFPVFAPGELPMPLKVAVSNLALMERCVIQEREVSIKRISGFYDLQEELKNGEILPFQSHDRLTAHMFNQYIYECYREKGLEKVLQHEI